MKRPVWIPVALLLGATAVAVWAGRLLSVPSVTDGARVAALDALAAQLDSIPSAGTLIVVDFTKPSRVRRLGVLDLATGAWIRHARVAHGRNSGLVYARDLSDEPGSLKSSGGLFAVGESFDGIHGVSLRLRGMEPGRNGNAEDRGIIVHAADYAGLSYVFANWRERFRLGRSEGCFAVTPTDYGRLLHDLRRPAYLYAFDGSMPAPGGTVTNSEPAGGSPRETP
jgi:hypothetical protein